MGKSFYLNSVSHNALERGLFNIFGGDNSAVHTIYHEAAANNNVNYTEIFNLASPDTTHKPTPIADIFTPAA